MSPTKTVATSPTAFVSTAIPYVNARPHLGHALEFVLADAVVAAKRLHGTDVWFTTGTDDNSAKNVNAAARNGTSPQAWVDANAVAFAELLSKLSIRPDAFVRTSRNPEHELAVHRLWQACLAQGDIFPGDYDGYYCVGCERFCRTADLPPDGKCPEHATPFEAVKERNLFFRLSRFTHHLQHLIDTNRLRIVPESARRETLAWLSAGLDDISVSRQRKAEGAWGIKAPPYPDPTLPEQTIWVWFDALTNYLSSLGFGADHENYQRYWVNATERVHVIGKGITRFHTIIWPALLLSAGLPLPTEILVHGYLTLDSVKISKSGGNAVDPFALIDTYGSDAIRYFLLRHVHPTKDGDFSESRLQAAYKAELADQLGNLLSRSTALIARHCGGRVPSEENIDPTLGEAILEAKKQVSDCQRRFAHHEALANVFQLLSYTNRYFDAQAPWALAKAAQAGDQLAREQFNFALGSTARCLVHACVLLGPYLPHTTKRALECLGSTPSDNTFTGVVDHTVRLFPK